MKKDFFISLNELIEKKQPVLLATIISQHGSSPRGTGSRMALCDCKSQIGTIGGGRIEAIIQEQFTALTEADASKIFDFVLNESEAANLEMICGGSISVLVDPIKPENNDLSELFFQVSEAINSHKPGWIISRLPEKGESQPSQKCFITFDGKIFGNWRPVVIFKDQFPEKIIDKDMEIQLADIDLKSPQILSMDRNKIFWEPIGLLSTVTIVGAGHIAQKLAPLTTLVGFRTIIMDDRQDFINLERFPGVDERVLLDDFEQVFDHVRIDPDSYIVIVTRGHQFDKSVLGQALNTNAGYIGMIGSRRKIKLTFEALSNEGFSLDRLSQVHSPIGLNIGAETPEEIAVSIVAEMIQHRSQAKLS